MIRNFSEPERSTRILALIITLAGLLPFILFLILIINNFQEDLITYYISIYSGLIVTFICGSNWVIIISSTNTGLINKRFLLSIFIFNSTVPLLASFLLIVFNYVSFSLILMGLLLFFILIVDAVLYYSNIIKIWWLKIRILGSLISSFCIILASLI